MKIKKILCFAILLVTGCVISQESDSLLQKAYKYNSKIILEEFFMNWENDSRFTIDERNKINERLNSDDTLKEVYELAKVFYIPINTEAEYFLIEDTLKYQVCNSDSIELCDDFLNYKRSTNIFFPLKFDTDDRRILYFNSKFNQIFTAYFKSNETNIYKLGEEYEEKRKIFNGVLNFYSKELIGSKPYQYGRSDLLLPGLWWIVINQKLDKAFLTYYTSFLSYETSLWEKRDGIWHFLKIVGQGGY